MITYGEFKTLVLQHLDMHTVAGEEVPLDYNNQEDFVRRIPSLTNIALRSIATTACPIQETISLSSPGYGSISAMPGGWSKVTMPADYWRIRGNGIGILGENGIVASGAYKFLNNREILVRTSEIPNMVITYDRYPRKVAGVDDETLDCDDSVAYCASFYVAAELMRTEDAYSYQSLFNEYQDRLNQLVRPVYAEFVRTESCYDVGSPY